MRILYVGNDLDLLKFLHEHLEPKVVRCPPSSTARSFIKEINYDLILLDESERELTEFIRSVRKETPVVYSSTDFQSVVEAVNLKLIKTFT